MHSYIRSHYTYTNYKVYNITNINNTLLCNDVFEFRQYTIGQCMLYIV